MTCEPALLTRTAGRGLAALVAGLGALVVVAAARPAHAGSKEAQAQKALKQALDEDYLETRFDDAEQKLRAAIQGCGKTCPAELRGKLHAALAAVLAGGKKELEDARDEFIEALTLDPKLEPNPDLLSTEVKFAYEQARKQLRLAPGPGGAAGAKPAKRSAKVEKVEKAEKAEKAEKVRDAKPDKGEKGDDDKSEKPKEAPPKPAFKNWISISFSPDIAVVSGTNVCTNDSRANNHYACVRPDGSGYVGTPTLDNGDNINAGVALATMRLMLGYDRLLVDNVTLGLRAGFAFNGASGGKSSFLPVHAEGRLGIWPGHAPFAGTGVRPFFVLAGGVAQVDAKINVQVLEDGRACGAQNPADTTSPCQRMSSDGVTEKREQTLTVYKQNGLGFASLAFGVQFAPAARVALHLAARASVTFPVVTAVISPEGGLSVGF